MVSRTELAKMLQGVNVNDVAREAQVSTKTVYRLRHAMNAATLDTAARLIAAVKKLSKKR